MQLCATTRSVDQVRLLSTASTSVASKCKSCCSLSRYGPPLGSVICRLPGPGQQHRFRLAQLPLNAIESGALTPGGVQGGPFRGRPSVAVCCASIALGGAQMASGEHRPRAIRASSVFPELARLFSFSARSHLSP